MSGWEKFKILSTGISAIVIAIAAILTSFFIEKAYKEGEISAKYVEIAVQILKESPDKTNQELRLWAIEIINKHSDVKLPEKAKRDLIEKIPLPYDVGKGRSIGYCGDGICQPREGLNCPSDCGLPKIPLK